VVPSPLAVIHQAGVVALLNLRTLRERRGASLAAMVGVAGVVATFVAVLSIAAGFRAVMTTTGLPDRAIVLRGGSNAEMYSVLSRDEVRIIAGGPGVARGPDGPLASSELFVIVDLPKRSTGTVANVPLRGVQQAAFAVRDEVRIVEGRGFENGKNEIIVGSGAAKQFAGLELGSRLRWGENAWTVVGIFDAGGRVADSELWCDVAVLQPAYRRGSSFESVYVRLESPEAFTAFKAFLTADPRLDVQVLRESEYFEEQSRLLTGIITGLGSLVAGLMGIGAVFGALNTMYSAVAARTREIATLRALGFGGGAVVASVLAESLLLALVGGVLGGAASYVAFNGYQTSTINWQSFSQVAFAFAITPRLMAQGIAYALLMGLVGGLFPAIRAARIPVARALREL
jgi:putative ABC transport system permease protein